MMKKKFFFSICLPKYWANHSSSEYSSCKKKIYIYFHLIERQQFLISHRRLLPPFSSRSWLTAGGLHYIYTCKKIFSPATLTRKFKCHDMRHRLIAFCILVFATNSPLFPFSITTCRFICGSTSALYFAIRRSSL